MSEKPCKPTVLAFCRATRPTLGASQRVSAGQAFATDHLVPWGCWSLSSPPVCQPLVVGQSGWSVSGAGSAGLRPVPWPSATPRRAAHSSSTPGSTAAHDCAPGLAVDETPGAPPENSSIRKRLLPHPVTLCNGPAPVL